MSGKASQPASSFHDVNGTRIHVTEFGHGPPLVLLHGWPETSATWRPVMDPLSRAGYRVIAPDLRGLGESRHDTTGYEKDNQAQDLAQLLDALGCEPPVALVGHDIGGMVAFAFTRRYPHRVSHLALAELALPGLGLEEAMDVARGGRWHFGFFMTPEVPELLITGKEEAFFGWWFRALGHNPAAWDPDRITTFVRAYRGAAALHAGFAHYRTLLDDGTVNRAWAAAGGSLPMPVLALGGEHSTGDQLGQALQPVCLQLRSAILPGSGHFLSAERPAELAECLDAFLHT